MDLIALGIAVGMASVAGVRAFLPLALTIFATTLILYGTPPILFVQMGEWLGLTGLVALVVLVFLEIALDKLAFLERPFNWAMIPLRALSGAVIFVVVMVDRGGAGVLGPLTSGPSGRGLTLPWDLPTLAPWLAVGAAIAGTVAVLKVMLRPPGRSPSSGVSHTTLSIFEDIVAVVGGIVGLFVPLLPILFVAFLLFFFNRVRRRRGRKYEGLRILRD